MLLRVASVCVPALVGLYLGCGAFKPSHCGYLDGSPTCADRDPSRPYCNVCDPVNDGCGAAPVVDPGCQLASDGAVTGTPPATDPTATTLTDPQGPTTEPAPPDPTTTGFTTTPVTSETTTTTTTEGPDSDATSSTSTGDTTTTDDTTTTTDDTTTTTTTDDTTSSDDTTGPPPPMCGNGEIDGEDMCDGMDLGEAKCTDFAGKGGGTLKCSDMCTFDTSECCLAINQACSEDAQCCPGTSCKLDLFMLKQVCKE